MTDTRTGLEAKVQLRVSLAAALVYFAYRLLGATKQHAWDRAKADVVTALMDKVVEKTGLADPRNKGKDGIQAFFEGGSIDGETRFVSDCGAISVTQKVAEAGDARCHVYRRTNRMRGQQVVFSYRGLVVPTSRASALDDLPLAA